MPTTTLTTQTFDSDAAALNISTIQSISVFKATKAVDAELKHKEERRQRRKARKEMKRLMEAGVVGDGGEFEGFQGSGGMALLKWPSGALQSREGFGNFISTPPPTAEKDDENADLDGSLYARKNSKSGTHSNSNGGTSDSCRNHSSLSRTSASVSDRPHHHQPIPNPGGPKSKFKHPSTSQSRSRSNTSSQSPSLQLPSSPTFSDAQAQIVSPSTIKQGQSFFNLEDELPVREGGFTRQIGGADGGGFLVGQIGSFPMTGFGGTRGGGGGKRSRDFGAFLARRGDVEEGRVVGDGDGV